MKETEKEEAELLKKSDEFQSKIDESLLRSYLKIRSSVKNGLAVVPVERGASTDHFLLFPHKFNRHCIQKEILLMNIVEEF